MENGTKEDFFEKIKAYIQVLNLSQVQLKPPVDLVWPMLS
jgi:hypothetical protein